MLGQVVRTALLLSAIFLPMLRFSWHVGHSSSSSSAYVNNKEVMEAAAEANEALPEGLHEACLKTGRTPTAGEVKLIYYTKVRRFFPYLKR